MSPKKPRHVPKTNYPKKGGFSLKGKPPVPPVVPEPSRSTWEEMMDSRRGILEDSSKGFQKFKHMWILAPPNITSGFFVDASCFFKIEITKNKLETNLSFLSCILMD